MCHISVVVPLYKCSESISELTSRLLASLPEITDSFEIIYVNDGSPEGDWERVVEFAGRHPQVGGVSLSRNFGQHMAITAGLGYSRGQWIVVMDGDLQDRPESIPDLYRKAQEGYDAVFGRRVERQDTYIKRMTSRLGYRVFDYLTGMRTDGAASNFCICDRRVIDNYLRLTEHYRLFPLLIRWQGFRVGYVDVEHGKRVYGSSSYSYRKLINLALDAIVSQSNRPLKLSIKLGFVLSALSFPYLCWLVIIKLLFEVPLGWTSLMTAVIFIGGLIFANLGLIGLYIGKIYDEVKNRPLFIVADEVGLAGRQSELRPQDHRNCGVVSRLPRVPDA